MNEGYACGSVIKNNKISNFYSGIAFIDGYEDKNCLEEGNILIDNNEVTECIRGFTIYKNSHCESLGRNDLKITITNNTFTRSGEHTIKVGSKSTDTRGVHLPNISAGITIENNTFNNFAYGVWMDKFVDYVTVKNNTFSNSGCGISITDISNNPNNYTVHINHSNNTNTNTPITTKGLDQSKIVSF